MTHEKQSLVWLLPFSVLLGACGSAAATRPHDMSAAQHQAAADAKRNQAAEHEAQYVPQAAAKRKECAPGLSQTPGYPPYTPGTTSALYAAAPYPANAICWMDTVNPTAEHQEMAEKDRKVAAEHRAASQALVAAEQRACEGLTPEDRDISPFAHDADVERVSPLRTGAASSLGGITGGLTGARIVFRAVPGLSVPWLQRLVDCHLARNGAIGHEVASKEMAYCPLTLRGARAEARQLVKAFAVDITSDDTAAAEEIWRRAEQLAAKH